MQLEILTFCDAAAEYGGRLNLLGVADTIHVPHLPHTYARCAIACRFRMSRVEQGDHAVRLVMIDADGHSVVDVQGKVHVQLGNSMSGSVNLIVNLNAVEFKDAGEYAIEVAVSGVQLGTTPLFVHEISPTVT